MRKYILIVFATLVFLLPGCQKQVNRPQAVAAGETVYIFEDRESYTGDVYEIVISETLLHNDSVGNDWQKSYTCDSSVVLSGNRWTVPSDTKKTVRIDATITEADRYPDVSSASISVILRNGFETSTFITVTENKGKYKGNTAEWEIICKVNLVNKLMESDGYLPVGGGFHIRPSFI